MKNTYIKIREYYRNFVLYAYVMYFIKLEELQSKAENFVYNQNNKITDRF